MSSLTHATEPSDVVNRLRRILSSVQMDCECRTTLDGALDRFSDLESRRQVRNALEEVRRKREWIAAQLSFLAEFDEMTEHETDASIFEEIATLFDEIAESAKIGARTIRETTGT